MSAPSVNSLNFNMDIKPIISPFFDPETNTVSYLVQDPHSQSCAVIDSVMDIDYAAAKITYNHADTIIQAIEAQNLELEWIIETHVHADHLSAAPYIQQKLGGKIGIGAEILTVQNTFGKVFNEGTEFQRDGSQFDALFQDHDCYNIGSMRVQVMHTPGHTPACMTHIMGNAAFIGDTLFMPDSGSARADFPGGDAATLYDSIMKILTLPDKMRLFLCNDYGTGGRKIAWETSVAEQKSDNIHVSKQISKQDFIALRTKRDASLPAPKLIIPSLQVNMRAGNVPTDSDGKPMLKVPLTGLSSQ